MRIERCCQHYTCGEPGDNRCGGCCRDLGYCQSREQRPDCRVCEGAMEVRATSLLIPVTATIPCPRCAA